MSGEQLDQTAPMLVTAKNAATVSGMFGMYDATRSPGRTPISRRLAAIAATCRSSSAHETSDAPRASERAMIAGRSGAACRKACSA